MKTYLSIDRGASNTDFVLVDSNYKIITKKCINTRDWNCIINTYNKMIEEATPDFFIFTGSANNMPLELKDKFFLADEIESIAFGGAYAASREKCIVISMGTGTAVVLFDHGKAEHIGGTGVGGGTMLGLGKLLTGEINPKKLNKLSSKGNPANLNLILSEIGYSKVGILDSNLTVSNFGNLKSNNENDKAAAIECMIAEVIGVIASLTAKLYQMENDIIIIGNLSGSTFIREQLKKVGKLYKTTFTFPENPEYLTAIGAVESFRENQNK